MRCIRIILGVTRTAITPRTVKRTATAAPVARVQVILASEILRIAHTATIGDLTSRWTAMTTNIWIWVTSLVERVMRLGVENSPISAMEKSRVASKTPARIRCAMDVPMTAMQYPVTTVASMEPRAHPSMRAPSPRTLPIAVPGVTMRVVMVCM